MKAAVVNGPGQTPRYADFLRPVAVEGQELISVRAAALSQLTKSRASGTHYSAGRMFPAVAGVDGVGITQDGSAVYYFVLPGGAKRSDGRRRRLCDPSSVSICLQGLTTSRQLQSRIPACRVGQRSSSGKSSASSRDSAD